MVEEEIEGEKFNDEDFNKCKELKIEIDKKYDYYSKLCITKNIDVIYLASNMMSEISKFSTYKELEPFFSLDEKQTQNKIEEIRKEIKNMNSQIIAKSTLVEQYKKELKNFEKQKKHVYEDKLDALDVLLKRVEILSQKLSRDYPKLLKNINDKKIIQNDFERLYYDEVSKYLGSRIGVFRHIDKTYEAKKIDLRSGIIYTCNDDKIYLSDMGTGQSQSAYLLGLLNIKDDKRKIIALFDEVAMMDDVSMKPIIDKMKNLYNDKKLLIGVIVQMRRGPEVKTTSLLEEF
jgi:exonuclease SbcC